MKKEKVLFTLLFLLLTLSVSAQRERNYIYLFDCTKSMTGFKGNVSIWERTKTYLKKDIEKHSKGTTLHLIPFQDKVYPAFNFTIEDFAWKEIEKALDEHVKKVTNTNICDAWDAIDCHIDKYKDNYIILLTDGQDNVKGMDNLAMKLKNWCGKYTDTNAYAFYVLLTEAAINKKVEEVVNMCDHEFIINATKGIPVFGSFEKGHIIYANTLNLKKIHKLNFSAVGEYAAKSYCNDPYFSVKIIGGKIKNGVVALQILPKKPIAQINAQLPQTYNFAVDIKSKDVSIVNPTIQVQMTNKPERTLDLISEEVDMGNASWYDSFLFWRASEQDTLNVDLKAIYNNEARKDGSTIEILIADQDGGKDFQTLYNGQPTQSGRFVIDSRNNTQSILSVVFNTDAKEGKRYFKLQAKKWNQLDKVNEEPAEVYVVSLRSDYDVVWNPLKTILLCITIVILALLLLWFLMIKHFVYPSIKVKTIQINEPYFSKINVKGKRRIVFTNKNMSQGLLNRLFTGEILYKKNDIWTSPLSIEAGTKKNTLRVMRTKDYVFDPYTAFLELHNDYVVENVNDNTKIKISIN